jgi:glycosyltransferase involved in cell wall biosynthesis
MEYMALGKAVIATGGGGTPEIVVDGETGFLIPPRSPEILAEKIIYLLENKDLCKSMGIKGRQRVLEEFSMKNMMEGHLDLYRSVASTGGSCG